MSSDAPFPVSAADLTRASPCTWFRLRKLSRQLTQLYDRQLAGYDLTVTQYSLLAHLSGLDGIGVGALAEVVVMDPTALTRALKPLERQALITTAADEKDKRARRIRITEQGRARYEAARVGWRRAQGHVDGLLQANGVPSLNGLLEGLIDHMKATPAPPDVGLPAHPTASAKDFS